MFRFVADAEKLDFYFAPFETLDFYRSLELRVKEFGVSIPSALRATELGDGFQNALVLSILQAFEQRKKQGAIILLEEPEMFDPDKVGLLDNSAWPRVLVGLKT
jgi:hypothetical protein